jgi:hypothetical protein
MDESKFDFEAISEAFPFMWIEVPLQKNYTSEQGTQILNDSSKVSNWKKVLNVKFYENIKPDIKQGFQFSY